MLCQDCFFIVETDACCHLDTENMRKGISDQLLGCSKGRTELAFVRV